MHYIFKITFPVFFLISISFAIYPAQSKDLKILIADIDDEYAFLDDDKERVLRLIAQAFKDAGKRRSKKAAQLNAVYSKINYEKIHWNNDDRICTNALVRARQSAKKGFGRLRQDKSIEKVREGIDYLLAAAHEYGHTFICLTNQEEVTSIYKGLATAYYQEGLEWHAEQFIKKMTLLNPRLSLPTAELMKKRDSFLKENGEMVGLGIFPFPSSSDVYVDGAKLTNKEKGKKSGVMLSPGYHYIVVKKSGYLQWAQKILLRPTVDHQIKTALVRKENILRRVFRPLNLENGVPQFFTTVHADVCHKKKHHMTVLGQIKHRDGKIISLEVQLFDCRQINFSPIISTQIKINSDDDWKRFGDKMVRCIDNEGYINQDCL